MKKLLPGSFTEKDRVNSGRNQRKEGRVMVADDTKDVRDNSLGAHLRRDQVSPFRFRSGNDQENCSKQNRGKIACKNDVLQDTGFADRILSNIAASPNAFGQGSSASKFCGDTHLRRPHETSKINNAKQNRHIFQKFGTVELQKKKKITAKQETEDLPSTERENLMKTQQGYSPENCDTDLENGVEGLKGRNSIELVRSFSAAESLKSADRVSELRRSRTSSRSTVTSDEQPFSSPRTVASTKDSHSSSGASMYSLILNTCAENRMPNTNEVENESSTSNASAMDTDYVTAYNTIQKDFSCIKLKGGSKGFRLNSSDKKMTESSHSKKVRVFDGTIGQDERKKRLKIWLEGKGNSRGSDEELRLKAQKAENEANELQKELQLQKPYKEPTIRGASAKEEMCLEVMENKVKKLLDDKRMLLIHLANQINARLNERSSTYLSLEFLRQEIDSLLQSSEREKISIRLGLENELNRRSNEWESKLEKMKLEEKRLRERAASLAEQNISLQRELSHCSCRAAKVAEYENLNEDLKTRLKDAESVIQELRQNLIDSEKQKKEAEYNLQQLHVQNDEKECANQSLQSLMTTLQGTCKNQERTINRLRKSLYEDLENMPQQSSLDIAKIHYENMACPHPENSKGMVCCTGEENFSIQKQSENEVFLKRDQELWTQFDELQSEALFIIYEKNVLCNKLLDMSKNALYANSALLTNGGGINCVLNMKGKAEELLQIENNAHTLENRVESLKKNVYIANAVLKERLFQNSNKTNNISDACQQDLSSGEVREKFANMKRALVAECNLSRLFRELLSRKEEEVKQLQDQITGYIRNEKMLSAENINLQNQICNASHKFTEMENQLSVKDQERAKLGGELESRGKELEALKMAMETSIEERHFLEENILKLEKHIVQLNAEMDERNQRVLQLEDDIMIRDGEISILYNSFDG